MFVFDTLTYNESRNGRNILYSLDFWQLMLTGHGEAFSTRKGVPKRLKAVPLVVGQQWKSVLSSFSEESLSQDFGDVLDEKRVRALAQRAEALAQSD